MATPLGHLLCGGAIGAALSPAEDARLGAVMGAFLGAAADLDFVPGLLLGNPARFHHLGSHSLLFAALAAGCAALVARSARWRWSLMVGLAYGSHLLLDCVTFDPSLPHGIPILWPFSSRLFASPVPLLPGVWHTGASALSGHNLALALLETALFGPLLLWALRSRRKRRPASEARGREWA
jgi:membrane-bound metal-dependent hydrolase YbcI (DUF457 family)